MKVRDLVKKLKKLPQDLDVHIRDHDQDDDEVSSLVTWVGEVDSDNKGTVVAISG